LQCDAVHDSALVERDTGGTTYSETWITADIAFDAAYLVGLLAQASPQIVLACLANTTGQQTLEITQDSGIAKWHWNGSPAMFAPAVPITAMQFYTVELHSTAGTPQLTEVWIDGVSVGAITVTGTLTGDIEFFDVRGSGGWTGKVYVDNYKIGSTRGASDIFSDDFEGTLSGWGFVSADTSIIADPGIAAPVAAETPATLAGIKLAFDDPALEPSPTWTRIDELVSVRRWSIKRGRPTERDKTGIGTATISGIDTGGVLDPTNTTGPYYVSGTGGSIVSKLDPVKQVAIGLRNPVTGAWSTIYRGFAGDWNYDLDISERHITFDIECVDALDILADAEIIPDTGTQFKAGNTVPGESIGDVAYDPGPVDDRIRAALADAALSAGVTEWPAGLMNIFSGNVLVQQTIYSSQTPLLQVIDDASDAEFPGVANRFVSKDGVFTFHGRYARFNPAAYSSFDINTWKAGDEAAFAGDSSTAVISGLAFTRGKTNLINAALATPNTIADADIAGQFVADATSVAAYGARSISFPNLITSAHVGRTPNIANAKAETKKYATYYKDNYKDPRTRVSQITFRPQGLTGPRATATWALICGIELSDVITLTTTHPGGGGFSEDFFVEGLTYEADVQGGATFTNVTLTVDLSPKAYYDTVPFVNVASFTPSSGSVGSSVTITGSGFTGATAVTFNGTSAVFSVVSFIEITATVPVGATTGPIAVTTPAGSDTSATSYTVV
jgi:hypothetical protein